MIKKILILLTIFLSFSCSCKKHTVTSQETNNSLYELATKEYGENFDMVYNTTKDFVLIKKGKSAKLNDPFPTIFFSIIDTKLNKVVYKDVVPGGRVSWSSGYNIQVKSMVGRPKDILNSKKQKVLYRLNVKSLKKFR